MRLLIIGLMLAAAGLSACSNVTKEKLGLNKKAPDEFMVTTRPPLSLPPEYDLRPVTEPTAADEAEQPQDDAGFVSKLEESE